MRCKFPPTVDIGGNEYLSSLPPNLLVFEGIIVDLESEIQFVVINQNRDNVGTVAITGFDVYTLKQQAKTVGHELGSHVGGIAGQTQTEHPEQPQSELYTWVPYKELMVW